MPPRTGPMYGASLTGIINSNAQSDEEARNNVKKYFGSILVLLFILDIGCALSVLWIQCQDEQNDNGGEESQFLGGYSGGSSSVRNTATCLLSSIRHGFHFHPIMDTSSNDDNETTPDLGDLFLLAVLRCILTSILLFVGVRYGRINSSSDSIGGDNASASEIASRNTSSNDLTEPLLSTNNNPSTNGDAETEGLPMDEGGDEAEEERQATNSCCNKMRWRQSRPEEIRTVVLVALFVTGALYQVYAGLKVATLPELPFKAVSTPLLCLTVLWINAQAYVFRNLLSELTRSAGLFLPPEVHRHPMFLETNRALSVHWCDLCRQRIRGGCYRCGLCDFDCCFQCSRRTDAATVGEDVLRGDRGVRAETAMTTGSYIRRTMQVAKSEWFWLSFSFTLLVASTLSTLFLPHFQGHIIDKVIPNRNDGTYDKAGFLYFIKIYIWLMLAQGAVSTLYSAIFTLVSRRLKFTIRNALLEKILAQDVAYFDGTESGRLISRLTNELDLMMSPIQSSLSSLLSNVLLLFGGMVMCFVKSYRLSMLAFVTVGPISYLWQQYALWSKGLAREMISYWGEGNSIATQALSHVRTVKAFGCEDKVLKNYSETNQQALYCGIKDAWGNGVTSALTGYLDLGAGVLILYFGGLLVYNGEMSVGELVTFQLFWNMMNNAYQNLQGLVTSFTRSAAGAEKIFSLWDADPDIDPKKGNDISWNVSGHLQLHDVTFYYQMRPDNIVLRQFNLEFPAGKTVALVGRSGGGKSTIINLLLRFYDPREGKIQLDGRDYESLKVHQLRRLFGVVTQETELFALTVEENIAYGLDKEEYTMEDVITAAKKAYAHDFICEMKDGYQTRIGERGNRLSGGQRQRLAIARVFLRRPRIILLDEATSALDENSQEAVQQALSNLIAESQATVVLVAHRLSTVINADSICVIDKGTVLEQGNHEELVAKGGVYASMVAKQLSKKADLLDQDGRGNKSKDEKNTAADTIDDLLAET